LHQTTWISARNLRDEVERVVDALNIRPYVQLFAAEYCGFSSDEEIVARCWNLERLNGYYAGFITRYGPLFEENQARLMAGNGPQPEECFVQRFLLVHDYRASPYVNLNLPPELPPEDWLGEKAAYLVQQYRHQLTGQAGAYVDAVLARAP
jgi:phenylacetic acid degradation operon negative regulatory protein